MSVMVDEEMSYSKAELDIWILSCGRRDGEWREGGRERRGREREGGREGGRERERERNIENMGIATYGFKHFCMIMQVLF